MLDDKKHYSLHFSYNSKLHTYAMQYHLEITNVLLKKFGSVVFAIFYEWLMQDSLSVLRISVHKFEALSYLLDRACVEKKKTIQFVLGLKIG